VELLSIKEVCRITGNQGKSSIYDQIKRGAFPVPVRIGPNRVGWKRSDVEAWIASRPEWVPTNLVANRNRAA
jgi:prophage regulatory protein